GQLYGAPLQRGTTREGPAHQRDRELADRSQRDRTQVRGEPQFLSLREEDRGVRGFAETGRTRRDRFEHRLNVRRRLANDPQDLAGRRLLLQGLSHLRVRLRQRPILLLELGEQPHVLDRYDGLVGEGLE